MSVSLRKKRAFGKARRKPPAKRKPPVAKRPRAKAKPAAKVARPSKPRKAKARRAPPSVANIYHPGPLIDDEDALNAGLERLTTLDPELVGKLIAVGGRPPLRRREPGFAGLVWIIVSQQVSTASANAIFKRIEASFAPLGAASLLAADDAALRACGLSSPKMRALRAVADAIEQRRLDLPGLASLAAEEAHRALVAVKGIGPWTADIFLLFCLGHPDAFPAGDLALQEAARLVLGLKARPDARTLVRIAERWRPLRGVAARLLWAYYRAARHGRQGMALAGA
ncbi:MAG TPA: DNA-3-methyladenine glycosylase 2 family protein [Roseiarcus sp.]|nr:DNA-3-methyladenine glycosylase 2 family protein [Roseiarcus sp.]